MRNLTWLNQVASVPPGGGGGGIEDVEVFWSPDGGAYTEGMEITASWAAAPATATRARVITSYSTNGGASYIEATGGDYDHLSPLSPFTFNTEATPGVSSGNLIILTLVFADADFNVVGYGTQSLPFTYT